MSLIFFIICCLLGVVVCDFCTVKLAVNGTDIVGSESFATLQFALDSVPTNVNNVVVCVSAGIYDVKESFKANLTRSLQSLEFRGDITQPTIVNSLFLVEVAEDETLASFSVSNMNIIALGQPRADSRFLVYQLPQYAPATWSMSLKSVVFFASGNSAYSSYFQVVIYATMCDVQDINMLNTRVQLSCGKLAFASRVSAVSAYVFFDVRLSIQVEHVHSSNSSVNVFADTQADVSDVFVDNTSQYYMAAKYTTLDRFVVQDGATFSANSPTELNLLNSVFGKMVGFSASAAITVKNCSFSCVPNQDPLLSPALAYFGNNIEGSLYLDYETTYVHDCPIRNTLFRNGFQLYAKNDGLYGWLGCPSGQVTDAANNHLSCKRCEAGTVYDANLGCAVCAPSSVPNANQDHCDKCWSLRTNVDQTECLGCGAGTYEIYSPTHQCSPCDFESSWTIVVGCPMFSAPNRPIVFLTMSIVASVVVVAFVVYANIVQYRKRQQSKLSIEIVN